jgi:hypothetical protein
MRMDHLQRQLRNNQNASIGDCCQERETYMCMLFTPLMRARLKGLNRVELVDPHLICFNTLRALAAFTHYSKPVRFVCWLYGRRIVCLPFYLSFVRIKCLRRCDAAQIAAVVSPTLNRNDTFHSFF